ncbi:aminotransferase class V-fold PLP-dependent enzyme [Jeotgalibacillus sp. R-1-5s-1]|uniref:aminotransferase class V-fold PLP-dependent enzyme n=1 Tax=Jeotgalibacillus sp. R-1-5s-1 TaxID=2555897 RepID=UPI001069846D|nr:aminotransferase class V-fold PLP-dependent enzyme [Jeotgalibacillus sp. R-1-5s-1]TFE00831.1 aminotransferase class V-fold PLP-dependent enzyme [Jeotgalibacillus sp. R-1-5s-1]
MRSLVYKVATDANELKQIHSLNYETFVEEIPQHDANEQRLLVDRFHEENTYMIAKEGPQVVGMIAVRSKRPFSLDAKLGDLDAYLPEGARPCEIRLLSIRKEWRSTQVFYRLCEQLLAYCLEKGFTIALISGTVRQLKLYKRIGFEPFADLVGTEDALYQPMYLTKASFERSTKAFERLMIRKHKEPTSLLPGPVQLDPSVVKAFNQMPISHRSKEFSAQLSEVKQLLCDKTQAKFAAVAVGTGTLANDLVAAQLSLKEGRGLILSNGEFGERLVDHAERFDLNVVWIREDWNVPFDLKKVSEKLAEDPSITWLWTVHCETSTGYATDLQELIRVCRSFDVDVCLDACSSVGVMEEDYSEVLLASTVSGKGLGSYPGLAFVLHREEIKQNTGLPRYLDLGMYSGQETPYTHSSNLVSALCTALNLDNANVYDVRAAWKEAGLAVLGDDTYSQGIVTALLPSAISSRAFGDRCKQQGVLISYESEYLLKRNWIQAAVMGSHQEKGLKQAIEVTVKVFEELGKATEYGA